MSRGLRVAMVTANFHPYQGGAERQALAVARSLTRRGCSVTVFTRAMPELDPVGEIDGIGIVRLWRSKNPKFDSPSFFLNVFWTLLRCRKDFDVYHAHLASGPALAMAAVGWIVGRPAAVKLGGGVGVGELAVSRRTRLGRLKWRLLDRLHPAIVTVNEDMRAEVEESGLVKSVIRVIPNGVDPEVFRPPTPEEREEVRRETGIPEGEPLFVWVGRIDNDKGQLDVLEIFLRGWRRAKAEGVRGEFWIVGGGPMAAAVTEMIKKLQIQDSVSLKGSVADPAPLYRACDAFVLPTRSEGMSNAMLEAMASGLPVLASRVSGTTNIVAEDRHGLLFDPDKPEEAQNRIAAMVSDQGRREAFGRNARALVLERYGIEKTVDAWMKVYGG